MLVFWDARLVVLAVPKTGTQAYEAALAPHASIAITDPPDLKHAPVYRYNRFFRPMFEKMGAPDMELAAVIREPESWLSSWYRYRLRNSLVGKPNSTRGVAFEDFVAAYCEETPPPFANVGAQSKFVAPRPNGTRVQHLFRYENSDAYIAFLESRLGVSLDLPRRNVSPDGNITLSKEGREKLRRVHAKEYALWESLPST